MITDEQRPPLDSETGSYAERESHEGAVSELDRKGIGAKQQARAPSPSEPYRGPGSGQGREQPKPKRDGTRKRTLFQLAAALAISVAGFVAYGYYNHSQQQQAAQQQLTQREQFVPQVLTQKVKADTKPREFHLPSNTQPFDAATLYARQSGYIAQRLVDIGDHVKQDQLLVVIAAPEVDDQLAQARAQLQQMQAALAQSEANRALANVTNNRTTTLVQQGWETKQTGDQNRLNLAAQDAAVNVARANITAQEASVARLERLQSYERVIAPFNGTITQRNVDVGSLVTADSANGTPLFAIANIDVLRVQVYVPQDMALSMKPGLEATLEVPEMQGRQFKGTVTRTATSLDPQSRTLLVEVDIENQDQVLTAGLYGIVHFLIPRREPVITVPSQAILFNQGGFQVAVVEDGKAHLRKITVGEDNGATVQVAEGLKPGDEIIPAGLKDGAPVRVLPPPPGPKQQAPQQNQAADQQQNKTAEK